MRLEDKRQEKAIYHDSGHALILAGPGSGKTYVLTHHIAFLVNSNVPCESILVLTFTKKAAVSMQSRFNELMPYAANRVVFGTFHSVFYRFLKIFNSDTPRIISETEKEKIIKMFEDSEDPDRYYKELIHERNLWDFDDILDECLKLMEENSKALNYIRAQFTHVLIDEFQDINEIQYNVIKMIFLNHGTVFAVGDQDQSIYAFRGALYDIMRSFNCDFKDVSIIELNHNYRSHNDIIKASERLISHNQNRLRANPQICVNNSAGIHFDIRYFKDIVSERRAIIDDVTECIGSGYNTALLLRTNKEVDYYKSILYDRKDSSSHNNVRLQIVNDIKNYTEYILTKEKSILRRIINRPERMIPESVLQYDGNNLDVLAKKNLGTYLGDRIYLFVNQMNAMCSMAPLSFLIYLRKVCGYETYVINKFPEYDKEDVIRIYDSLLDELKAKRSLRDIYEYLNQISMEDKQIAYIKPENCSILTFHQSKGLEFDAVLLPDVVEGKVPSKISEKECNVEEERRLFYVAMTRAKDKLCIYSIKNEESATALPSRFLSEI